MPASLSSIRRAFFTSVIYGLGGRPVARSSPGSSLGQQVPKRKIKSVYKGVATGIQKRVRLRCTLVLSL